MSAASLRDTGESEPKRFNPSKNLPPAVISSVIPPFAAANSCEIATPLLPKPDHKTSEFSGVENPSALACLVINSAADALGVNSGFRIFRLVGVLSAARDFHYLFLTTTPSPVF
jgi:hypothetical protein